MKTIEQKNAETVIAMQKRIDELQAKLEKYAEHLPNCEFMWKEDEPRKCTCGLEQALKGK